MATKSYIGIKNEAKSNTIELHFTDYIFDGFDWNTWEEKNMVQDTINAIKAANPDTIKIVINSLGGDVMIGLALYNYLKAHKAEKTVEIIGFAASIASIIAMCATKGKLKMAKNAFMIIHAAWSGAMGNADELREQAENLDKVSNNLAEIYADRSGKKPEDFTAMWKDGDFWMDGAEAMELGLVDELMNTEPVQAKVKVTDFSFKNIPERFQASEEPMEHKSFFQNLQSSFMNLIESMKNSLTATKADPKFENVANKEEILAMVEACLSPVLAELEALKPAEVVPTPEPVVAEVVPTPASRETVVPPAEPVLTAEQQEIAQMKAEMAELKKAAAGISTAPQVEKIDKNLAALASVTVEYN